MPVDGQAWTVDPWAGVVKDDRLLGRGAADMKSFLGIVLAGVPEMLESPLARPIHLAFSYDEEVGCIGVGRMIRDMQDSGVAPGLCIVGEPTSMKVVTGHKGKLAARAHVCGREAHSALAPYAVNALEYAAEIIVELRRMQREVAEKGPFNREYDPPYSTLHAGVLHAGTALNIVPRECTFDFEFRTVPEDDPHRLLGRLESYCRQELLPQMQRVAPESRIAFETKSDNPGLHTEESAAIVARIERLAGGGAAARSRSRRRRDSSSAPASMPSSADRARSPTRTSPTNSSRSTRFAWVRRSSPASSTKQVLLAHSRRWRFHSFARGDCSHAADSIRATRRTVGRHRGAWHSAACRATPARRRSRSRASTDCLTCR